MARGLVETLAQHEGARGNARQRTRGGRGQLMTPWYKVVTRRQEVREGRSFSPDELTIALEQVISETATVDGLMT